MEIEAYKSLREQVIDLGFGHDIEWSETVTPPTKPEQFAFEAIYVICNSGMKWEIAKGIFERVRRALKQRKPVIDVFRHPGKVDAINDIWDHRAAYFAEYIAADDKVEYLETLPWIGEITKWHLAKNFGVDCMKPDRHLVRIAKAEGTTPDVLCEGLARSTGDRIATVDMVLWRAAERGLI